MTAIRRNCLTACLFLSIGAATTYAQETEEDLFPEAERVHMTADSVNASLLSPKAYALGKKEYEWAKGAYASGGYSERIEKSLAKAAEYFRQAIDNSETAAITLRQGIEGREVAIAADASRLAPTDWEKGETELENAARELEDDKLESALQYAAASNDTFRKAELNAIRARYLTTARRLIAEAEQLKAVKLAPRTLRRAQTLLRDADAALSQDRYRVEAPRSLADEASYEARRAIYIASLATRVQTKTLSVEDVILDLETPLVEIATALEIEPDLSEGYAKTNDQIIRSLRELQELPDELNERDRQIEGLEDELRELDARLGGASAERMILVRRLEQQARVREQLESIQNLFTDEEAQVLRDGEGIIFRLVGLKFASSSSELGPEAVDLLGKVNTAIDIFPQCDITIEGHTDSKGNATKNLRLSEDRALAVVNYMSETMRIPTYRMKAAGYGDARPIANNKTEEGRAKNRRIDLIIVPKPGEF